MKRTVATVIGGPLRGSNPTVDERQLGIVLRRGVNGPVGTYERLHTVEPPVFIWKGWKA